jgi:hypothetical protein
MAIKLTQPLEHYALAFQTYLGLGTGNFLIKTNGIFLTCYNEVTYKVSHFDDLVWSIESYFSGSYTLVYTEISFGLWFYLFDKYKEVSPDDQIIDLYNAWKICRGTETSTGGTHDKVAEARQQEWEDFELFLERIKADPEAIVQSAIEISDIHLIPVIALAMRMRFPSEQSFYRECVTVLIERYPYDFGIMGDVCAIDVDASDAGTQRYFIGESEFDFHKYKETGSA